MRHLTLLVTTLASSLLVAQPALAQVPADDDLMTCGYLCSADGEPLATSGDTPPDTELVKKIYIGAFSEICSWAIGGGPAMYEPEVFDLTYRPNWIEPEEPDRDLRLYRFFCGAGAYNETHVYLTWTADSGVEAVSFAQPTTRYDYAGDDIDTAITGIVLTGISARTRLVNSSFDPETGILTEWSCWRGLCDASSRGEWRLDDGAFSLVTFDVDPTYDGEVNLYRVVDYGTPAQVDVSAPLPFTPTAGEEEED